MSKKMQGQLRKESEGKTDVCGGKRTANIIDMM